MKKDLKNIGLLLQNIRKEKGISAYELSLRLGKVNDYIYKVEKGVFNISLMRFIEICEILDVKPSEFFKYLEE